MPVGLRSLSSAVLGRRPPQSSLTPMRLQLLLLLLSVGLSAVEEGPFPVLDVIDGGTIEIQRDGKLERVRLLYVDAPEVPDNDDGEAFTEGHVAKILLGLMLGEKASVRLWAPGASLTRDPNDRLLACPIPDGWHKSPEEPIELSSLQVAIIRHGLSPYWRKYGDAPEPLHTKLMGCQSTAEAAKHGFWETAPDWMRDEENERTAPQP